jgi:hypothetical protein
MPRATQVPRGEQHGTCRHWAPCRPEPSWRVPYVRGRVRALTCRRLTSAGAPVPPVAVSPFDDDHSRGFRVSRALARHDSSRRRDRRPRRLSGPPLERSKEASGPSAGPPVVGPPFWLRPVRRVSLSNSRAPVSSARCSAPR